MPREMTYAYKQDHPFEKRAAESPFEKRAATLCVVVGDGRAFNLRWQQCGHTHYQRTQGSL
eukprot:scaffold15062_cov62-Phaeocystis_antarctica.AAC.2